MKAPRRILVDAPSTDLRRALLELVLRPRTTLWAAWSWKAACIGTVFRAGEFFIANLKAGRHEALHAMLIEAIFAIVAVGLLGAVSQRLRDSKPLWATAIVVWAVMPALITFAQFGVHHLAGTPHLGTGVILTFLSAALASSYTWYAMAHGALLGGDVQTPLRRDLQLIPGITRDYLLAIPRMVFRKHR